jgi:hypothetical protein
VGTHRERDEKNDQERRDGAYYVNERVCASAKGWGLCGQPEVYVCWRARTVTETEEEEERGMRHGPCRACLSVPVSLVCVCQSVCVVSAWACGLSLSLLVVPWGSCCLYPTCRIHVRRTRARAQSIAGTRIGASGRVCSRTGMHHRPCIVGTLKQASHRHARRHRAGEWLATQPTVAAVAAACTYGRGGCTAIPRRRTRCD